MPHRIPACLFTLGVVVMMIGCGNDSLSRSDAQRQLELQYETRQEYAYLIIGNIGAEEMMLRVPSDRPFAEAFHDEEVKSLLRAGFVEVPLISRHSPNTQNDDYYQVVFTAKAKPFLIGEYSGNDGLCSFRPCAKLVALTVQNVEILRIAEPGTGPAGISSVVQYRVTWAPTPIGEALGRSAVSRDEEAIFMKYDDGWRPTR